MKHHNISKTLIRYNTKVNCFFIQICYLLHKLEFQTSTPLTNQPSEERILNISKSSGTTSVEVKWNVYINYRPITTKFTAQVFRPRTSQISYMFFHYLWCYKTSTKLKNNNFSFLKKIYNQYEYPSFWKQLVEDECSKTFLGKTVFEQFIVEQHTRLF